MSFGWRDLITCILVTLVLVLCAEVHSMRQYERGAAILLIRIADKLHVSIEPEGD